jgi:hypothetical protein
MKPISIAMFVLLSSQIAFSADGDSGLKASVNVYSGRGDFEWRLTDDEAANLQDLISGVPTTDSADIPSWGYIRIVKEAVSDFPYDSVHLFGGKIVAKAGDTTFYYSDDNGALQYLMNAGNAHDPSYVPPPHASLPSNTAKIAVIQESYGETVAQGDYVEKVLTIFSEGSGELKGTIETPHGISVNPASFALPAVSGGQDFILTVDTGRQGEIKGDIMIECNDPANPKVNIPVLFIVESGGMTSETTSPVSPGGTDLFGFVPYAVIMVVLAAVAYLILRRMRR